MSSAGSSWAESWVRRPSRSTAEGNTQGRKTTWALSCSSMGMFRSSQGVRPFFLARRRLSSASIRARVSSQVWMRPAARRPARRVSGRSSSSSVTRRRGGKSPSFFLGAYSFTAARALWASDISARICTCWDSLGSIMEAHLVSSSSSLGWLISTQPRCCS